jgi:hypothetical protein
MTDSSTSTAHLPASAKGPAQADEPLRECQASAGATVKDEPEPVSKMFRNSVTIRWCRSVQDEAEHDIEWLRGWDSNPQPTD